MRVLIVDDQPPSRLLLRSILEPSGFTVHEAEDGRRALEALRGAIPDVVVSDVSMPGMDGFRLCRELRNDPRTARVPFVVYTGVHDSPSDRESALRVGADFYVTKPAPADELLATVRKAAQLGSCHGGRVGNASDGPRPTKEDTAAPGEKREEKKRELASATERVCLGEERLQALELIARGRPLEKILGVLLRAVEARSAEWAGRVLVLNETSNQLVPALMSASVAHESDALAAVEIGDGAAPSGVAAFRRDRVLVVRTAASAVEEWAGLPVGWNACWSTPVLDSDRQVLGVLDVLHVRPVEPTEQDLTFVDSLVHLLEIAIDSHRRARRHQSQMDELLRWQSLMLDREERICSLKTEINHLLEGRQIAPRYGSVAQPV